MMDSDTQMSATSANGVACVVRSVGERTTELCVELLESELGTSPAVISVPVHRDMVRRCFEFALEQASDVLIVIDADVLTYKGGMRGLLELYPRLPGNMFSFVPRIDDHLLGKERPGGCRLYRVSLLDKALELLPTSSSVRPESSLMAPMAALGHPSAMGESVFGLHDAEQYLVDVYRKAAFYGHRNVHLVPEMLERWRAPSSAEEAVEFRAALLGLASGVATMKRGPDFADHDADAALRVLNENGIVERAHMDAGTRAGVSSRLPAPRLTDRWWTHPTPKSLSGKVQEARRMKRSLWRLGARRLIRPLLSLSGDSSSR